jgi:hypothetical protein
VPARRVAGLRLSLACVACCAVSAALASSAQAAITGSHVTTPKDPRYLLYNADSPNTFAVKGTTSGGNPATDKVDLLCFHGASSHPAVATNVALAGDGSFSVPAADLHAVEYKLCKLRAVPAGTVPSNLTPFKGPLLGGDHRDTSLVSGGPNDGVPYDFYLWAQQRQAAFDYDSLMGCGIDDGYLNGSDLDIATTTFYCNAWLWDYENFANQAASTRSELQIDGADAYGPTTAEDINDQGSPGFPRVKYSMDVNPATGVTTIHESDGLVKCADSTYPPTPTTCPDFRRTGVKDKRTIVQDHAGRLSTITDVFKATDHHSHKLDLLWQNDQRFWDGSTNLFDATNLAYRFPGQNSFSTHAVGDTVQLPKKHPASILIKQDGVADGDKTSGRGAIVYDRRGKSATFNDVDQDASDFYLHQRAGIPKGGSAKFHFAYAQAFTQKAVDKLAKQAEKDFG